MRSPTAAPGSTCSTRATPSGSTRLIQIPDINALLYPRRGELPQHRRYRGWLYDLLSGFSTHRVSDLVVLRFIRLVTNRKIFPEPTPLTDALGFADVFRHRPQVIPVAPGPRHWAIFDELCRNVNATGGGVTDVHLAALTIEHGHELVTEDKGFQRSPGLRTTTPR